MKKGLFIVLVLISNIIFSQKNKEYTFGRITQLENDLKIYDKDSTANAIFLFENGKTVFKVTPTRILISTKYYAKIKIFNKEGVDNATVEVPIYHNKKSSEKVIDIKGYTHNSLQKTALNQKNIFTEKVNENLSIVKFTMPNIKEQSIIEYEYTLESPFKFNFTGWEFQSEIPKIYSRFHALIPGNYVYNRSLIGTQNLTKNKSKIKRNCFSIPGFAKAADCEELIYVMENIPAFIEEDFMTSKKNYLSKIKFEISQFTDFEGIKHKYTKTWKSVDKEFRTEKSIGRQLRKIDYIEKRLPEGLFNITDNLTKAKRTYSFIKNHFTWNKKISLFNDVNVKDAFDKNIGNSTEINIALINALNAVGLNAKVVLLSTRNNGLPTKVYPVITDFNYAIGSLEIDNKVYLLDATNELLPFGMLPFKTLNEYGRVMDFKKGSYWIDLKPQNNNLTRISMNLEINEDGNFEGLMHKSYNGYRAIEKREEIRSVTEEKYLEDIEDKDDKLSIDSYKNSNLDNIDKPLTELFDIIIESELDGKIVILNPFINSKITKNPFQLKERTYPVDFGYPRAFQFVLALTIPENFKVSSLPKNIAFKLPNGEGNYTFNIQEKGNKINMISRFRINNSHFIPEAYPYLKEFYKQIIKTQNSLITLEKIK
jgi:hypothetical protein